MGRRRSSQSIRSAYEGHLRQSYGDFRSPRLHFVMATADRQPFEGVLRDLAQTYPVEDGFGEGSLVLPSQPAGTTHQARVASVLNSHGFVLETLVPLALAKDRAEVTLYAALFEPEGDVPWPRTTR